ncbi:bacterioferritin comigratory protein [Pseudoalteromonas arctica]|uniref:Bacterioferritin comigratory protein n=1 Tax=Pseudoalteromonas arctica TaxID=394751 RepID=A0A7Y0HAF5_9GAMM|nr:bacterioferritin comigratory protein [Pseudoalteromonas arctica]NMM40566.1 bacterioferritin comigratory protein [Pseudoalteromonas arctica]
MTQGTEKRLIDALGRLLQGTPEVSENKQKAKEGRLKINNYTVEIEASLSVGALRNYDDIKKMIAKKSLDIIVEQSPTAESTSDLLEEKLKEQKKKTTQANKLKNTYYKQSKNHQKALQVQAAKHIRIVQRLMDMIPFEEREKAMDKVVSARPDNIIEGKFR